MCLLEQYEFSFVTIMNALYYFTTLFKKKVPQVQCPIKPIGACTPNANEAEMLITELKRMLNKVMVETGILKVLGDH